MIIQSYAQRFPEPASVEGSLVDGGDLIGRPGFWAAHFLSQSVEDEDLAAEVWGLEPDEIGEARELLNDPARWPVFTLGIGGGAQLAAVYRNFDEDAGVDHLLLPGGGHDCVRIATLEGEYEGPGISWQELGNVAREAAEPAEQAARLLLPAPDAGGRGSGRPGRSP